MNRCFQCLVALSFIVLAAGCDNYAKYTIDPKPLIKIDNSLLGIWKGFGDSNGTYHIIVQDYNDIAHDITGLDGNLGKLDIGIAHDEEHKNCGYFITYVSPRGSHDPYEQYTGFTSRVGDATFLNVDFNYEHYGDGNNFNHKPGEVGYCFVKLHVNEAHNIMTAETVADTSLKYLTGSPEVRSRIAYNINKASFYKDTLHLYKVSNYHASLKAAIKIAGK